MFICHSLSRAFVRPRCLEDRWSMQEAPPPLVGSCVRLRSDAARLSCAGKGPKLACLQSGPRAPTYGGGGSCRRLLHWTRPRGGKLAMRVLMVDDHVMFLQGLKALLSLLAPELTVDTASQLGDALQMACATRYQLVLLDWHLGDGDGD